MNRHEIIAAAFKVSSERIKEQYAANAKDLRAMHAKAVATGKKVGGFTVQQLDEMATRYENYAK